MATDGSRRNSSSPHALRIQHRSHGGDINVHANTKKSSIRSDYAVIRSYQPARIERELLAQVFSLIGRGNDDPLESCGICQQSSDLALKGLSITDFDMPVSSTNDGSRHAVLEEVA